MIETQFFDLGKFKKIEDAAVELDKLSNYEGWAIVCSVGKRNHILVLRRMLEDPAQALAPAPASRAKKGKQKMFPNAVYQ